MLREFFHYQVSILVNFGGTSQVKVKQIVLFNNGSVRPYCIQMHLEILLGILNVPNIHFQFLILRWISDRN